MNSGVQLTLRRPTAARRPSSGAAIAPERTSAWELGWDQRLPAGLRLDVGAWRRRVENYADPNVFFGTTIATCIIVLKTVSYTHLTLPTNREV